MRVGGRTTQNRHKTGTIARRKLSPRSLPILFGKLTSTDDVFSSPGSWLLRLNNDADADLKASNGTVN